MATSIQTHKDPSHFLRRWGLRLVVLILLGALGLYFAPVFAARTSLRSWILAKALEGSIRG